MAQLNQSSHALEAQPALANNALNTALSQQADRDAIRAKLLDIVRALEAGTLPADILPPNPDNGGNRWATGLNDAEAKGWIESAAPGMLALGDDVLPAMATGCVLAMLPPTQRTPERDALADRLLSGIRRVPRDGQVCTVHPKRVPGEPGCDTCRLAAAAELLVLGCDAPEPLIREKSSPASHRLITYTCAEQRATLLRQRLTSNANAQLLEAITRVDNPANWSFSPAAHHDPTKVSFLFARQCRDGLLKREGCTTRWCSKAHGILTCQQPIFPQARTVTPDEYITLSQPGLDGLIPTHPFTRHLCMKYCLGTCPLPAKKCGYGHDPQTYNLAADCTEFASAKAFLDSTRQQHRGGRGDGERRPAGGPPAAGGSAADAAATPPPPARGASNTMTDAHRDVGGGDLNAFRRTQEEMNRTTQDALRSERRQTENDLRRLRGSSRDVIELMYRYAGTAPAAR
eukprot:gene6911-12777_t